jgi:hypothetical protein
MLFHMIANVEKKSLSADRLLTGWKKADKAYILNTFGDCVLAVRSGRYDRRQNNPNTPMPEV